MTDDDKRELKHGYVTLKEHFEVVLNEREKRLLDKFDAERDALSVAKQELERRLGVLNELRQSVEKDRAQFVKQDVYDTKTQYYDEWCKTVDRSITTIQTRSVTWTAALGVIFIIVQILLKYWR